MACTGGGSCWTCARSAVSLPMPRSSLGSLCRSTSIGDGKVHRHEGALGQVAGAGDRPAGGDIRMNQDFDAALLDTLVCPATRSALRHDPAAQELVADEAGLAYPIRDRIPLPLVEAARRIRWTRGRLWRAPPFPRRAPPPAGAPPRPG